MYSAPAVPGALIANPLAAMRNHGLFRMHIERSSAMFHAQHAAQHEGEFVALRSLPRFLPSAVA
jgi:hypothetical protein